mmetsp:Transcript_17676/g.68600  ORF Transcript_17676/g.68600 Transcript_17676/m.68600 type:complete len:272 (-) Transcript_17676:77-892(-)
MCRGHEAALRRGHGDHNVLAVDHERSSHAHRHSHVTDHVLAALTLHRSVVELRAVRKRAHHRILAIELLFEELPAHSHGAVRVAEVGLEKVGLELLLEEHAHDLLVLHRGQGLVVEHIERALAEGRRTPAQAGRSASLAASGARRARRGLLHVLLLHVEPLRLRLGGEALLRRRIVPPVCTDTLLGRAEGAHRRGAKERTPVVERHLPCPRAVSRIALQHRRELRRLLHAQSPLESGRQHCAELWCVCAVVFLIMQETNENLLIPGTSHKS